MQDRGVLFAAGPLTFVDAAPAGSRLVHAMGMYIISASSREEAQGIAESEPFYTRGLRTYTLCEWSLNEGVAWQVARHMRAEAGPAR